jgi:hypothetical protein
VVEGEVVMGESKAFPVPIEIDEFLPPGVIGIGAAEMHLVRLGEGGTVEFISGPLEGLVVGERRARRSGP